MEVYGWDSPYRDLNRTTCPNFAVRIPIIKILTVQNTKIYGYESYFRDINRTTRQNSTVKILISDLLTVQYAKILRLKFSLPRY